MEKQCVTCGMAITRKVIASGKKAGKLEPPHLHLGRKFCSRACSDGLIKIRGISIKAYAAMNGVNRQSSNRYARRFLKKECEECGTTEKLTIHHVDLNWRNNNQENLMTLCNKCHSNWHAERGQLGRFGAKHPCIECGRPFSSSSRGNLCKEHYQKKRYRDLHAKKIGNSCPLCERPAVCRGYCQAHYKKLMTYGDPNKGTRTLPYIPRPRKNNS